MAPLCSGPRPQASNFQIRRHSQNLNETYLEHLYRPYGDSILPNKDPSLGVGSIGRQDTAQDVHKRSSSDPGSDGVLIGVLVGIVFLVVFLGTVAYLCAWRRPDREHGRDRNGRRRRRRAGRHHGDREDDRHRRRGRDRDVWQADILSQLFAQQRIGLRAPIAPAAVPAQPHPPPQQPPQVHGGAGPVNEMDAPQYPWHEDEGEAADPNGLFPLIMNYFGQLAPDRNHRRNRSRGRGRDRS